jgi:hypothetical protein
MSAVFVELVFSLPYRQARPQGSQARIAWKDCQPMMKLFVEELESRNLLSAAGGLQIDRTSLDSSRLTNDFHSFATVRSLERTPEISVRYDADFSVENREIFPVAGSGFVPIPGEAGLGVVKPTGQALPSAGDARVGELSPGIVKLIGLAADSDFDFDSILGESNRVAFRLAGSAAFPNVASFLDDVSPESLVRMSGLPMRNATGTLLVDGPLFFGAPVRQALAASGFAAPPPLAQFLSNLAASFQRSLGAMGTVSAAAAAESSLLNNSGSTGAIASALSSKPLAAAPFTTDHVAFMPAMPAGPGTSLPGASRSGTEVGATVEPSPEVYPLLPPVPEEPERSVPESPLARTIRAGLAGVPQVSGVLHELSSLNLDRLEQGLAGFIAEIEASSGPAASALNQRELYPWILSVVAAAAACELARRQLKKSASAEALEPGMIPGTPYDIPQEFSDDGAAR